jgi:hypothetical protein
MLQYFDIYRRNTAQINSVISGYIDQVCVAVKVWRIREMNGSICWLDYGLFFLRFVVDFQFLKDLRQMITYVFARETPFHFSRR